MPELPDIRCTRLSRPVSWSAARRTRIANLSPSSVDPTMRARRKARRRSEEDGATNSLSSGRALHGDPLMIAAVCAGYQTERRARQIGLAAFDPDGHVLTKPLQAARSLGWAGEQGDRAVRSGGLEVMDAVGEFTERLLQENHTSRDPHDPVLPRARQTRTPKDLHRARISPISTRAAE